MPETALENVKRTIARRESYIKKGKTVEGARGYEYCSRNIVEEMNELSKIKNMDSSNNIRYTQTGMVNIRCNNNNSSSREKEIQEFKDVFADNKRDIRKNAKYKCVKGKTIKNIYLEDKILIYADAIKYYTRNKSYNNDLPEAELDDDCDVDDLLLNNDKIDSAKTYTINTNQVGKNRIIH